MLGFSMMLPVGVDVGYFFLVLKVRCAKPNRLNPLLGKRDQPGHRNTGWARGPNCRDLTQKQPNGIRDEVRNRVDP